MNKSMLEKKDEIVLGIVHDSQSRICSIDKLKELYEKRILFDYGSSLRDVVNYHIFYGFLKLKNNGEEIFMTKRGKRYFRKKILRGILQ